MEHCIVVKHILKHLKRTRNYILVCSSGNLETLSYTDFDFQGDIDSTKSTSRYVFTLNEVAICWRSVKHTSVVDSTTKVEYVAAFEATKDVVWLKKLLLDLHLMPSAYRPITL